MFLNSSVLISSDEENDPRRHHRHPSLSAEQLSSAHLKLSLLHNYVNGLSASSPIMLFAKQNVAESSHFNLANTFQAIALGFARYFNVT